MSDRWQWVKVPVLLLVLFWALLFQVESVFAKSIVYTDTIPIHITDWNDSLQFPQFSPTQGILQQVEFSFTGKLTGDGYYENVSSVTNVITLSHAANLLVQQEQLGVMAEVTPSASASVIASPFDGYGGFAAIPPVFDGQSGGKLVMFGEAFEDIRYNQPSILEIFTGLGTVKLDVEARARANSWDSLGNIDFLLESNAAGMGVVMTYIFETPEISMIKLTNGADANNPLGADVPQILPGATVTWTYLVTNTGTLTIPGSNITVTDSHLGVTPRLDLTTDLHQDQQLSPGEQWTFIATGIAEDLNSPAANTVIVSGCSPLGTDADVRSTYYNLGTVTIPGQTVSDPSHYCNPPVAAIDLQKTVYEEHNQGSLCPGVDYLATVEKRPITYCFVVTNVGNTYLDSIVITDVTLGITTSALTLLTGTTPLAPGDSMTYFVESVVTSNLRNIAETEGNPTDGQGRDIPNLPNPYDSDPAEIITPTNEDSINEPTSHTTIFLPVISR